MMEEKRNLLQSREKKAGKATFNVWLSNRVKGVEPFKRGWGGVGKSEAGGS